mgnify:CR=1 FL=1
MRSFTINEQALITVSQTMIRVWHGNDWSALTRLDVWDACARCADIFQFLTEAEKTGTIWVAADELCNRMDVTKR